MISSVDGQFKHSVHFARRLPYAAHSVMSLLLCALYSTCTVDACSFSPILFLLASFTELNQGIHSIDLLVSLLFLMKALPLRRTRYPQFFGVWEMYFFDPSFDLKERNYFPSYEIHLVRLFEA